jgi:peptidyl-dipeptidase Dcp
MNRREFLKGALAATCGAGSLICLKAATAQSTALGPLLDPWSGPHAGVPRFELVKVQDFKAALLKGMELKSAEIKAITGNNAAPTFENSSAALEDCGRPYSRAQAIFDIYVNTQSDKTMQSVETEMTPLLAKFEDEVIQNDELFQRIKKVYEKRNSSGLTPEQTRLTEQQYKKFTRQGAGLDPGKKARLRQINEKLASLFTNFSHNLLADEEKYCLVLENEADLAGLPESVRSSAAAYAEAHGMKGKWAIANVRSGMAPFLTFSSRRDLREKGFKMWSGRGDNNDANDTKALISEILKLRAERARILGFASHAHWILDDNMARTPGAAMDLMLRVWKAAVKQVEQDVAAMQAIVAAEGNKFEIEPWDYRYYAEKVRKARYDVDQQVVREYMQLDKICQAMFAAAGKVYGIEMVKAEDVPTVHADVTVYEVRKGGKQIGLWYFDPFTRDGKRAGGWMSDYRCQEKFRGNILPVVSNNLNFVKGKPSEPALISFEETQDLFHEFGHALHALLSGVNYPSLSGTNVKRDFVELPSQLNERWVLTDEVLKNYALHYKTGKPIPDNLIEKLRKSKTFNQGFLTVEHLASGIYDMKIHLEATPDKTIKPDEFEQQLLAEIKCPREIAMCHRPTQFRHIFADDGYSAGYYVYIWADTMAADAAEAFKEAGSFYDRATCDRLAGTIFSVGNSVAPEVAFRNFRGRDVNPDALMRDRGFPVS